MCVIVWVTNEYVIKSYSCLRHCREDLENSYDDVGDIWMSANL